MENTRGQTHAHTNNNKQQKPKKQINTYIDKKQKIILINKNK